MKMRDFLEKLADLESGVGAAQERLAEVSDAMNRAVADLESAEKDLKDFKEGTEDAEICFAGDPCHDTKAAEPEPEEVEPEAKAEPEPEEVDPEPEEVKVEEAVAAPVEPEPEEVKAKETPKKKGKGWKSTPQGRKNTAEGRKAVASGERPPLKKAVVLVMGEDVMSAREVVDALEEKGWTPSSNNPCQYISYILSSNQPEVFERTGKRGYYRVRPGYLASQGNAGKNKDKSKGKKTKEAPLPKPDPELDAKIQDQWGDDVLDNVEADPYDQLEI